MTKHSISETTYNSPTEPQCEGVKPASNLRTNASVWLAIAAAALLSPFAINNILNDRLVLAAGGILVMTILAINAWAIRSGRDMPLLIAIGLVPVIITHLAGVFVEQGIIGVIWCHPAIFVCYFILPRHQALFASLCIFLVAVGHTWLLLDIGLAARLTASLIGIITLADIFVRIINNQQQEIEEKDIRREGIASASDKLQSPLTALIKQIEDMRHAKRITEGEQLDSVSDSLEHITHLVDDLYELSLADSRALLSQKQPERWDELVDLAIETIREKFTRRNLIIVSYLKSPTIVYGDANRLSQMIKKLLENCLQYSADGGEVNIVLSQAGDQCELSIADSRPSLTDDKLEGIFDRFYLAEAPQMRHKQGAGLGLALVKAIAEAHNGYVYASHAQMGGLCISVTLPLATNTIDSYN